MGVSKGKLQEKIILTSVTVSQGLNSACLRKQFFSSLTGLSEIRTFG